VAWAEAEIGQKLRFVQRLSAFDRLEFEDNLAFYDNVGDVAAIEKNVVVRDREWDLALERYALLAEFVAQAPFIDGFEQAGAEAAVYAHGQADDPVR
jgi:aminoglycoside phosphotransferase family enzyme